MEPVPLDSELIRGMRDEIIRLFWFLLILCELLLVLQAVVTNVNVGVMCKVECCCLRGAAH